MRRTEMILQIKDIVNRSLNQDHILEPDAERILTRLEEAGMKPPRLPEDHCQAMMHVYYAGYTFHMWEEEFEKDPKVVEALNRRRELQALTPAERRANRIERRIESLKQRQSVAISKSEKKRLQSFIDAETAKLNKTEEEA